MRSRYTALRHKRLSCHNDQWCDYCRRCEPGCRPMEDFHTAATQADNAAKDLVLHSSDFGDGGWSPHAPGTSNEDIADGTRAAHLWPNGSTASDGRARTTRHPGRRGLT
jgi:hypothetical protein